MKTQLNNNVKSRLNEIAYNLHFSFYRATTALLTPKALCRTISVTGPSYCIIVCSLNHKTKWARYLNWCGCKINTRREKAPWSQLLYGIYNFMPVQCRVAAGVLRTPSRFVDLDKTLELVDWLPLSAQCGQFKSLSCPRPIRVCAHSVCPSSTGQRSSYGTGNQDKETGDREEHVKQQRESWQRTYLAMRHLLWIAPLVAHGLAMAPVRLRSRRDLMNAPNQKELLSSRATAGYPDEALQCYEITNPVLSPDGIVDGNESLGGYPGAAKKPLKSCQVQLMDHVFANSYGQPFVGK